MAISASAAASSNCRMERLSCRSPAASLQNSEPSKLRAKATAATTSLLIRHASLHQSCSASAPNVSCFALPIATAAGSPTSLRGQRAGPVEFITYAGEDGTGARVHADIDFVERIDEEIVVVVAKIGVAEFDLAQPIAGQDALDAAAGSPAALDHRSGLAPRRLDKRHPRNPSEDGIAPRREESAAVSPDRHLLDGDAA